MMSNLLNEQTFLFIIASVFVVLTMKKNVLIMLCKVEVKRKLSAVLNAIAICAMAILIVTDNTLFRSELHAPYTDCY